MKNKIIVKNYKICKNKRFLKTSLWKIDIFENGRQYTFYLSFFYKTLLKYILYHFKCLNYTVKYPFKKQNFKNDIFKNSEITIKTSWMFYDVILKQKKRIYKQIVMDMDFIRFMHKHFNEIGYNINKEIY